MIARIAQVAQARIEREGHIVMTKVVGGIVATKWRLALWPDVAGGCN